MNGVLLHLHAPTHSSIYLGMPLLHVQNVQVCLVILWQKIHLQLHEWKWVSFDKKFICNFMSESELYNFL